MDITSFEALANETTALQILTNKKQELVPGANLGGPVMDCCFYLKQKLKKGKHIFFGAFLYF